MSDDPFRDAPTTSGHPASPPPPNLPPPPGGVPTWAPSAGPPPGYVGFGTPTANQLDATAGLRTATITLFVIAVIANAATAVAVVQRRSVFDDFVAGSASFTDLEDADSFVGVVALITIVLALASAIVLSIWSLRIVRNFLAVGGSNAKPGWACGGWYIPIGNLWVPWGNLRRGHKSIGGSTSWLSWWQGMWIVGTIFGFNVRTALNTDATTTRRELSDQLDQQVTFSVLQTVVLAISTYLAIRATRDAERSVAARVAVPTN